LMQTDDDLRRKPDPRVHLEMGLLRLINAARLAPLEELLAEVRSGAAAPSIASAGGSRGSSTVAPRNEMSAAAAASATAPRNAASSAVAMPFRADRDPHFPRRRHRLPLARSRIPLRLLLPHAQPRWVHRWSKKARVNLSPNRNNRQAHHK
jgi:DNA polymerase III gamma/tau subunit